MPQLQRKTYKQLGTPTVQFEELNAAAERDDDKVRAGAREELERRAAEGEVDEAEVAQGGVGVVAAPALSTLVGKQIEVSIRNSSANEEPIHSHSSTTHQ